MMYKACGSIEEVPYCFSRSYVKLQGHAAKRNRWFWPKLGVSGLLLQLEFTDGYGMMHRARSSIEEVPYCFSRSYVKSQGHTALKIVDFDPNWAFPDCNSSLNSPMVMKCCTKLQTAKKRRPIVFQGHPSNIKVTRDKTSPILTQIGRFRTIGRSQLSDTLRFALFSRSYIKFQGHTGWKIDDLDQIWARLLGRLQLSNPSDLPCHICWLLSCPYLYISRGYLSCSYDDDKILFHENMSISYLLIPCFLILPSGDRFTSMDQHNTLSPRQNGRHFPDNFKCIFLNGNVWISIKISLKFVPEGPINNIPALVQIMAWRWPGQFTDAYMRHQASMS